MLSGDQLFDRPAEKLASRQETIIAKTVNEFLTAKNSINSLQNIVEQPIVLTNLYGLSPVTKISMTFHGLGLTIGLLHTPNSQCSHIYTACYGIYS